MFVWDLVLVLVRYCTQRPGAWWVVGYHGTVVKDICGSNNYILKWALSTKLHVRLCFNTPGTVTKISVSTVGYVVVFIGWYHQGTYPRTEPTVGQAHRIFFHAQNSAQRFHWMFWHSCLDQQAAVEMLFSTAHFEIENCCVPPCPKSANITLSDTSSLYTQFHIENARPKVGNDFADAWLN